MIRLVLGLGNIGEQYQGTRHNMGFEVVWRVSRLLRAKVQPRRREYDWAVVGDDDHGIILGWPRMLMNGSGLAVRALLERTALDVKQLLVVVDDFSLPLGRLRFRQAGGDGGHNGLASIIEVLETPGFARLRMGIGPVPDNVSGVDFVLDRFTQEEKEPVGKMIETAAEAVAYAVNHRFDEVMTKYNVDPA